MWAFGGGGGQRAAAAVLCGVARSTSCAHAPALHRPARRELPRRHWGTALSLPADDLIKEIAAELDKEEAEEERRQQERQQLKQQKATTI